MFLEAALLELPGARAIGRLHALQTPKLIELEDTWQARSGKAHESANLSSSPFRETAREL